MVFEFKVWYGISTNSAYFNVIIKIPSLSIRWMEAVQECSSWHSIKEASSGLWQAIDDDDGLKGLCRHRVQTKKLPINNTREIFVDDLIKCTCSDNGVFKDMK